MRRAFPEADGAGEARGALRTRTARPGEELLGVVEAAGAVGGGGVGEGFLVEADRAAEEPVEGLRPEEDEQQAGGGEGVEVAVLEMGEFVGEDGEELRRGKGEGGRGKVAASERNGGCRSFLPPSSFRLPSLSSISFRQLVERPTEFLRLLFLAGE